MKSRSEVLRDKQAKKSAAERTPDMFEKKTEVPKSEERKKEQTSTSADTVTCEACEAVTPISKLEKDGDKLRCPDCAAVIKVDGKKTPKTEEKKPETKKTPPKEEEKSSDDDDEESESAEDPPKSEKKGSTNPKDGETSGYCGECGSAWPYMDGKPWPNCGHKAIRVDDPRKATNPQKVTPSGVNIPPKTPLEVHDQPIVPQPVISFSGNRMSIGWGKASYPVGEAHGFKFSNMEIAQQIITVDLPEGANRIVEARKIIAELQQITDLLFDTQLASYREKLKRIDK